MRSDAKPRKWFINEYLCRITLRKVNGWDEIHQRSTGKFYFDTWEQAYAHLTEVTKLRLKKAKAELPNAQRAVLRVAAMKPPTPSGPAA